MSLPALEIGRPRHPTLTPLTQTVYEDAVSSTVPVFTLPKVVTAQLPLQLRISTQIVQE